MSESVSRPMQSRTRSGVTPVVTCSCLGQLGVGGRRGVDRQATDVADVGEVAEQLETLDEAAPRLGSALDAEGEDRAAAIRQVLDLAGVPRARLEAGIAHPLDLVAGLAATLRRPGRCDVALHAHAQGLETLQEEERVQGGDGGADVAQVLEASFQDVLGRAERLSGSSEKTRPW